LLRCALAHGGVRGGPAAVADALLGAAREHGVELAFDTEARALRLEGGRVAGVETQAGEIVATRAVALTCDPRRALELLPAGALPLSTERALAGVRLRGNTAVLRLALAGPLAIAGRRGEHFEAVRTAGSLDELERAADALKYGALPERPWLDLRVPTFDEPALAPSGCHVVTALVHGVPYAPRGGWTDELRQALRERALDALEQHAPGARRLVLGEECLVPDDIEARYGATGGHLHHGDHALDQLWVLRPSLDTSRYSTPIPGLWLCGSGSHPGGGITCAPGILAARAMLWP
jgi:phytoene dehydrogenase-like protein